MVSATVLVVEDEAIIGMEIKHHLEQMGYRVLPIANHAEKALETVEFGRPDIILMDIRIKGDTDGIETAALIREKHEIPIVFLTAYMDEEKLKRARLTMPFGYILKPVQDRDLRVTIEMALYTAETDRKRREAERELRESLKTSQDIVHSIPSGLFIYRYEEPDRLILIDANPEAKRLTKVGIEEHRGMEFNQIWPKALETGVFDSFLNVYKTGINYETEDLYYEDENLFGAYRIRVFAMPNHRLGVAFEDITERKRAEEELSRSYDIVDNIQVGLHIYRLEDPEDDRSLRMISANRASEMITGIPNETLIGNLIDENFPASRENRIPQAYASVVRDGKPLNLDEVQYGDDRVILSWFKVRAFPLHNQCMGAAFEDITEQKIAQSRLQENEALYHAVVDSISDGFGILDQNLFVSFLSSKAEQLLKLPINQSAGKHLFDLFPDAEGSIVEESLKKALLQQEPIGFESRLTHHGYSGRYNARVHPFKEGLLVFIVDLNKKKNSA